MAARAIQAGSLTRLKGVNNVSGNVLKTVEVPLCIGALVVVIAARLFRTVTST